MKRLLFILILISFVTLGCEGNRTAQGYVFDAETKAPLKDVLYRDTGGSSGFYFTDATGRYYIEGPTGSCVLGCPDFDTEFSKPGYKTIVLPDPKEIVFLEKK